MSTMYHNNPILGQKIKFLNLHKRVENILKMGDVKYMPLSHLQLRVKFF